jgi:DNA-binding MarR family transcriptional regulator
VVLALHGELLTSLEADGDGLTGLLVEPDQPDTYAQARRLGTFRAQELAEALGISVTNANNRLKRLVQAGALSRNRAPGPERGGKEFVYTLP